MEFERAIFRVYERSMEGILNEEENPPNNPQSFFKQPCRLFEYLVFGLGLSLLACLVFLHSSYVGNTGCLPEALSFINNTSNQSSLYRFHRDSILLIKIDSRYLREKGFDHGSMISDDNTDDISDNRSHKRPTRLEETSKPNQPYYDRARSLSRYNQPHQLSLNFGQYLFPLINKMYSNKPMFINYLFTFLQLPKPSDHPSLRHFLLPLASNGSSPSQNHTKSSNDSSTDRTNYAAYYQDFDYMVTFDWAVTILDNDLRAKHQFELVNITIPGYQCFGSDTAESLLPFGGFDRAVLNNIIFTIRRDGFVWTKNGNLYHWQMANLLPYQGVSDWFSFKIGIVWYSVLAFFLLSTTTALLVRILISSGVVLIFPIFWIMQCAGMNALNLRIMAISYPWIGIPLQILAHRQQSVYPFLVGHFIKVILYYLLYIAAQSVYLKWLYNGSTFIEGQLWLYAVMMIWEYYSMIYVRAEGSIVLFPRASLALFLIFHFYFYSFPSGFHLLALMTMFVFLIYIMAFCIRHYETKAFRQGLINIDQPRMLYTSLPWPSWRAELAPEYTLFMPVNQRSTTVYQNQVPSLTGDNNNPNNNNNASNINTANTATNNLMDAPIQIQSPRDNHSNNNIELSTMPRPLVHENEVGSNGIAATSQMTPLSFFSRFLSPANYQSINTMSTHSEDGLMTTSMEARRETVTSHSLRIPLNDVHNTLHRPVNETESAIHSNNSNNNSRSNSSRRNHVDNR